MFTSYDILISLQLTRKVQDQCAGMQSFIFKTGSRYQSIADTNHYSTTNVKQRMVKEWDRWMEGGRTATADEGEDPLLPGTLIINTQRSRSRGRQDDAEAALDVQLASFSISLHQK